MSINADLVESNVCIEIGDLDNELWKSFGDILQLGDELSAFLGAVKNQNAEVVFVPLSIEADFLNLVLTRFFKHDVLAVLICRDHN